MYLYLVCYDIEDNRSRRKLAEELAYYGERVQESVFEIFVVEHNLIDRLIADLNPLLSNEDSLRFYFIPADAKPRCQAVGPSQCTETPDRIGVRRKLIVV